MTEIAALFRRQDGPELLFHLIRFLAFAQTQPSADPDAVGIADNAAGNGLEITQQKVGGFSSDTGKFQ